MHSSSTTGQQPSRIVVDKTTAFRQSRALVSILKEHIGNQRRPFLVLDAADSVAAGDSLTARGAAIRGVGNFASETVFAMTAAPSGDLAAHWDRIAGFFAKHRRRAGAACSASPSSSGRGSSLEAERRGVAFDAPEAILLHSGGWKKLAAQAVSKDEFSRRTAAVLGTDPRRILDFYGMVEQVGTVFVDCPAGNKHAPAFADVILRRPLSLRPVDVGETGIIEVLSALPTSYPGHALLDRGPGRSAGRGRLPLRPQRPLLPLHQPRRARRTPRLRRHLRPIARDSIAAILRRLAGGLARRVFAANSHAASKLAG